MKISEYIKETKGELKHVNWPTRKQTMNFTLLVIGVSFVTAIVLGILDFIFSLGLEKIIVR
jgi:preprotein translocase subunit SecE